MSTRILPVRERALRAVENAMATIQKPTYNTSVRHVRRRRDFIEKSDDAPEIHIMFGKSMSVANSSEDKKTLLDVTFRFYLRALNDQPDTEFNFFLADIQRILANGIQDTSAVALGGPAWPVTVNLPLEDEPFYWMGNEGDIVGELSCQIAFTWCNKNPNHWGVGDVNVPE